MAGWSNISLNGRALAWSLLLAVGAGIVSGLVPGLAAMRLNLVDQLKTGSRAVAGAGRTRWLRNVFAVSQIALAVALVIGAALMSKGLTAMLHSADPYNSGQLLTFNIHLPVARYDTPRSRPPGRTKAWKSCALCREWSAPRCPLRSQRLTMAGSTKPDRESPARSRPVANRAAAAGERGYFGAFHIPLHLRTLVGFSTPATICVRSRWP